MIPDFGISYALKCVALNYINVPLFSLCEQQQLLKTKFPNNHILCVKQDFSKTWKCC